jgi:outer membrane protein assembly factor BamB
MHAGRMTAGVPIIDLDVTAPRARAEPRSLRVRLVAARPILVVGVFVLVLGMLAAAVAPAQRMTHVLSAGGTASAAFVLGPDSLYTAQFGSDPNSASSVRAFSLTDGSLRWAVPVAQNVQNLVVDPRAHVLMSRSGVDPRIVFLDTDTGDALWHSEDPNTSVVGMARGGVLIRTDLSRTVTRLRLADARTGREVWARIVDPTSELGPDDLYGEAPSRIVAVGSGGEVTVLNYADGAVLSQGDLRVSLPVDDDPIFQANFVAVSTIGDHLYLSRRDHGRASLTAYTTVPFAQQWRVDGGPVGRVIDCGPVLCVADTRFVSAVDPATGAQRWSEPAWSTAFRYDATTLFAYDQQETPGAALLDARTGRVVRRLGQTIFVDGLLLRSDLKIHARTWVARTDPVDGLTHTIGSMDTEAPYGCEVRAGYLACPTSAGPTGVWLVPGLHLT